MREFRLFSDVLSKPIVEIELVQLDLSWVSALKGEKRFDELLIQGVEIELTLEELRDALASHKSRAKPQVFPKNESNKKEFKEQSQEIIKKIKSSAQEKKEAVPESDIPAQVVLPVDDFEGKVILRDLNLKFYSTEYPNFLLSLSRIQGEVPLWGKKRSGELVLSEVQIGSCENIESLRLPLKWENGLVEFEEPIVQLLGVTFSLKGSLRLVRGLPYGVALVLPPQRINFTSIQKSALPIDLLSFRSESTLQGYLLSPTNLYGKSKIEVGNVIVKDLKDGSQLRFERGRSEVSLSPAGLYARQFYLIGDEDAVLGNGYILNNGEGAATIRLVASPMRAREYENRVRSGSQNWLLAFEPLVTPDRMYRDFRFDFSNGRLWIDIRKDGKSIPFQEVFGTIYAGLGAQMSPNLP